MKEYFDKEELIIFVDSFEKQGYVIDGKEEKGLSFSTTQIEHMTSELYITLCSKYDIYSYDTLEVTSCFYSGHGSYYIAFDEKRYNLNSAKIVLDEYINSLQKV